MQKEGDDSESKRRNNNTMCTRAENIFKSSLPWLGRDEIIESSGASEDAPVLRLAAKTLKRKSEKWCVGVKFISGSR